MQSRQGQDRPLPQFGPDYDDDTASDDPRDTCVHELFEQQAARTPDAVAVVLENQQLTYRELNGQANQLARHLRTLGVGPEVLVGLCVERSLEMVIGLLGILKAGGAYVPLDPAYPRERLALILADAGVKVLLTQEPLLAQLPAQVVHVLCLDRDAARLAAESQENPARLAAAENVAYVIFTSGSTGRPKGCMVTHHNVVRLFLTTERWFHFRADDVWTLFHSVAFDFSVWEMWGALLYGGRLVIVPHSVSRSPDAFYKLLVDQKVTVLNQTPSAFAPLMEVEQTGGEGAGALRLRYVIFGGEALNVRTLQPWFDRHGDRQPQLVNMYGITETTVHVTYRPLTSQDLHQTASPIGCPIPDLDVYLLDPHGQPVPTGAPGEMFVGGAGVARGYLNRPELTAARFVVRTLREGRPSRFYRTGDLARWLADGSLEFLGRLDDQVKLRGFRIELGEIAAVLSQCPGVAQSVVVLREDRPGDKRLVAYYVPGERNSLPQAELTRHVREKLPEYMVPSAFVSLERLPLTPNGKVDRRALPPPARARPDLETGYVAPRTTLEERVAAIWADILGLERVGVHDNFFDLGGHSLLATRVMSQVCSALQVEMPVRSLFDAPTIAGLAENIGGARRKSETAFVVPVRPVSRAEDLPLSFAQERLWFLAQLEPENAAYHLPYALRLRGALDVDVLLRSFQEIVRRHEVLRTVFETREGAAVQVVRPPEAFAVRIEDLRDVVEDERAAGLSRRIAAEAVRPFDLQRDLPLRAAVLRMAEDESVLLVTLHHIASDAWSEELFWRELDALYAAYVQGQPSPLRELPLQYADFAVWQKAWLHDEVLQRPLDYWRTHLRDLAPLELPTDRPRPPQQSYRGATRDFAVLPGLADRLRQLSRAENVTLHMTLLAAFQTLLARYSGQEDIAVGLPIAGRQRAEWDDLIGLFVNTLVLRTDLSGQPTFRELLARVRRVSLDAYDHQDLPFVKLVEELNPQRHLGRSPLVQVVFQLLEFPDSRPALQGLKVELLPSLAGRVRFDLEMHLWTQPDRGLRGSVVYSTDLFEAATIERLVGHFETLLAAVVADPDQRVSELPLLTEAERRQLLLEWNDTARDYPRDRCVHQLFEEQAERTPDAVAVVFGDRQLTYRELNAKANQLAHHLEKRGVGPEELVAICIQRSPELIVGMLAVLKAGGAYLPLDAGTPPQRLAFMLADGQVRLVFTQRSLRDRLAPTEVPLLCLDEETDLVAGQSQADPRSSARAENLAYVMYTSGSTGVPKGVEIPHRAINRLLFGVDYARFDATLRVAQLAPIAFDASTLEIWGPLLHGGCCVLFPEGVPDFAELEQGLRRHRIQTLWLTASLFNALVDERPQTLRGIEQLLIGGEALSLPHVRRALRLLGPTTQLMNGYGPTECTTFACCFPIPEGLSAEWLSVPIGRPIGNTQAYVLDPHRQPAPIGVPGELYLGGDGLARGYRNRPELTAERFVASPFHAETRLYRTGDRVRWRTDGTLEFLGRLDNQVKVRGFRIEPGEIEAVLGRCPGVAESAVALREDRAGEKRLVGYYVARDAEAPAADDLRSHLKQNLPEYMVPAALVMLEALPLTSNGKVDHRALPAPDVERPELARAYTPPRTPLEEMLARIWAEMLGLKQVSTHDTFFELGGHSLLAARMVDRVQKTTRKPIPLATIFRAPTIAEWARHVASDQGNAHDLLEPIRPTGSGAVILCVGSGMMEHLPDLVPSPHPLYWCKLEHVDGKRTRYSTIEDLAAHYCRQISAAALEGPYVLCGYSFGGIVAFETACQLYQRERASILLFLVEPSLSLPKPAKKSPLSRIAHHLYNLPAVPRGQRSSYLYAKAHACFQHATRWTRQFYCGAYMALGLSLPVSLRWAYVEDLYERTVARYVPRPFPGRLVLVTAKECPAGYLEQWARLAEGGLAIHQVRSSDHGDLIVNKQVVAHWADLLRQHLQEFSGRSPANDVRR